MTRVWSGLLCSLITQLPHYDGAGVMTVFLRTGQSELSDAVFTKDVARPWVNVGSRRGMNEGECADE